MTLPEFLGVIGGALFSIIAVIAALLLGYGFVGAIVAVPVGFLMGWAVGVAMTGPVMRAIEPPPPEEPSKLAQPQGED